MCKVTYLPYLVWYHSIVLVSLQFSGCSPAHRGRSLSWWWEGNHGRGKGWTESPKEGEGRQKPMNLSKGHIAPPLYILLCWNQESPGSPDTSPLQRKYAPHTPLHWSGACAERSHTQPIFSNHENKWQMMCYNLYGVPMFIFLWFEHAVINSIPW